MVRRCSGISLVSTLVDVMSATLGVGAPARAQRKVRGWQNNATGRPPAYFRGVTRPQLRDRTAEGDKIRAGFAELRIELEIPDHFPDDVLVEARRAAADVTLPDRDETSIPFVTIDPASSRDLDQALHVEQRGTGGFRVRYAIADVPAFIAAGGPLDRETRKRGLTVYSPDSKSPLHPPILSEDAASLLPDVDRPAFVWEIDLDSEAGVEQARMYRARVRSVAKLGYESVQHDLDSGVADPMLVLLRSIGLLRQEREAARGGVSLPLPSQEIIAEGGSYDLVYKTPDPVEGWNAQISLLTGMCAATMMIEGQVGILRTMPDPNEEDLARVRRTAKGLHIEWPPELSYPELIRSLDPGRPRNAAFISLCATLLRGAGYTAFDGQLPELTTHSAVAAPYAHVTAPIRRLVDRFALEVCVCLNAGVEIPSWASDSLFDVPELMAGADRRSRALERGAIDFTEAIILADHVGESFDAVVVESRKNGSVIQLYEPAVRARMKTEARLGNSIRVKLLSTDPTSRSVAFEKI